MFKRVSTNPLHLEWNCIFKVLKIIQPARITQTFQKCRSHFKILRTTIVT